MKKTSYLLALLSSLGFGCANAALLNFTGEIEFHNDVAYSHFTLDSDVTDVRIWTDSYMDGANFDPITALWDGSGNLIVENDDGADVNPATQSVSDSGFTLSSMAAGDYVLTVAIYDNWAIGNNLSDGFGFDLQDPMVLSDWCQSEGGCSIGSNWSVWLEGTDVTPTPGDVPEPATFVLLGLGLAAMGVSRRKRVS